MQQIDLDLPEQHPVLDDSDVTLRQKKSRYRREKAGASLTLPSTLGLVSQTASLHILTSSVRT